MRNVLEHFVLSQISDSEERHRHNCVIHLYRILNAPGHREPIVSLEISETEYNSDSQVSILIDGP